MDIFHVITQEIEHIVSCHWLDEFRASHKSNRASRTNSPAPERSASSGSVEGSGDQSEASSILSRATSFSEQGAQSTSTQMGTDKRMDTEPGGEQTQYEGASIFNKPHAKDHGQFGVPSEMTSSKSAAVHAPSQERGEQTADNIRYGQQISESGVGGFTNTATGTANQEGGYGDVAAQSELENSRGNSAGRTEQGYSAKDGVHDYKVGG